VLFGRAVEPNERRVADGFSDVVVNFCQMIEEFIRFVFPSAPPWRCGGKVFRLAEG
jgi:hypothetical protein